MSKYRLINRLSKPKGTEIAHEQSLHNEPYKPVYATEAYAADVAEAMTNFSGAESHSFRNPNIAQRAVSTREKLNAGVSIDKDNAYGEDKWFIDQCRDGSGPTPTTCSYLKFTGPTTGTAAFSHLDFDSGDNIEYSKDQGVTWEPFPAGHDTPIPVSNGEVWVRGKSGATPVYGFCGNFTKVEGKITSLLDYEDPDSVTLAPDQFSKVIYGDTSVDAKEAGLFYHSQHVTPTLQGSSSAPYFTDASALIMPLASQMTASSDYAFSLMFNACIALTQLPTLTCPAIALGTYDCTFYGCKSLTSIPEGYLNPTFTLTPGVANYSFMFSHCTNLATIPDNLLDTPYLGGCRWEDTSWGYQSAYTEMFSGCTSLNGVHNLVLPATDLTPCCYGHMFMDCSSMQGCPTLSATALQPGCYKGMFWGCTSVASMINLYASTLADSSWSGMQSGETRGCYQLMYSGCTSLIVTIYLDAATLTANCYEGLFQGCSSLNEIYCRATDISASGCTTSWVDGVSTSGTFHQASTAPSWSRDEHGIPVGWSVTNDI